MQQSGAESTEKLIQSYLDKYAEAGQQLTYNQALEEITADAMETVFGTAESFRDFVRQQAAEARMNVEARGIIGKVMDKIQSLLESVLADVEHFLKKRAHQRRRQGCEEPDGGAAAGSACAVF